MTLFDRYIAVDWSAANGAHRGKDSIWIAEREPEGDRPSLNPPTRADAMTLLVERVGQQLTPELRAQLQGVVRR